jgi:hypothetical protein
MSVNTLRAPFCEKIKKVGQDKFHFVVLKIENKKQIGQMR